MASAKQSQFRWDRQDRRRGLSRQTKPICLGRAEKTIAKGGGLDAATRGGQACKTKPISRFRIADCGLRTGDRFVARRRSSNLPSRGRAGRLCETNPISGGRDSLLFHCPIILPFPSGANRAKQSQTWAGWDVWGSARQEGAKGAKRTQLSPPAEEEVGLPTPNLFGVAQGRLYEEPLGPIAQNKANLGRSLKLEVSSVKTGEAVVRTLHFLLHTSNSAGGHSAKQSQFRKEFQV